MFSSCLKTLLLVLLAGSALPAFAQEKNVSADAGSAPKTVVKGVVNGSALTLVKPGYPRGARDAGAGGAVTVEVTIDENGNVIAARAVSGHPLLTEMAETAALQSKFTPTLLSGVPVKVKGIIVYNFQAGKELTEGDEALKIFRLAIMVNAIPLKTDGEGGYIDKVRLSYPALVKEVESEYSVKNASPDRKVFALVESLNSRLEGSLPGTETWHYALGKKVGELMTQAGLYAQSGGRPVDMQPIRTLLVDMRAHLKNAPEDFPPAIARELNILSDLADNEALLLPRGMDLVGTGLAPVFAAISEVK
jgi:TonB family protein